MAGLLNPQSLYNHIETSAAQGQFSPLYFFYGDEPFLLFQAYRYLKLSALNGGSLDFNFTEYTADEADLDKVVEEIETIPMMFGRRVVVLRNVEELKDSEWSQLLPLIEKPVDSTVFILIAGAVDKRKKWFKTLVDKSISVEFKKPFDNQIPGWIYQLAKARQFEITDEAVQLVHRLVGNSLQEIDSELSKLKEYVSSLENPRVGVEHVSKVVARRKHENVFEFVEVVALGDRVQALIKLADLLQQGQNEIGIVSLVARHLRILQSIKLGQSSGLSGVKLAQQAQVPPYYLNEYIQQARSWSQSKIEQGLLWLAETDKALKSAPGSSHIWMENLVLKITKAS